MPRSVFQAPTKGDPEGVPGLLNGQQPSCKLPQAGTDLLVLSENRKSYDLQVAGMDLVNYPVSGMNTDCPQEVAVLQSNYPEYARS